MSDIQKQIDDLFEEYIPSPEMVEEVSSLIAEEVEEYKPEMITEDFIEEAPKSYIDQLADQMSRVAKRTESAAGQERLSEEQIQLNNFQLQIDNIRRSLRENTVVSGIGQGGDGQTPGSGEVLFSRLDDVHTENIQDGQTIIWNENLGGFYPGAGGGGGAVDSVNGQTGTVLLDAGDVGAATAAQGATADTALQPGEAATPAQGTKADNALQPNDNVSELNNDAGYITAADIPADAVTSVNTQTGDVVLDAAAVGAATTAQGSKADSAVQPGDLATVATTGDYDDLINKPTISGGDFTTLDATNDGSADVTTAVKDWLESGNAFLYAPPGIYRIDTGVVATISNSISVLCAEGAVFTAVQGLDADIIRISTDATGYSDDRNISVSWTGGKFDMRLQARSTSVPFADDYPAQGAGGQGTSATTDGLAVRGEVNDGGTRKAGLYRIIIKEVMCWASDTNHWLTSGGDSGVFASGARHVQVTDSLFIGCRDLGIYASGISEGAITGVSCIMSRNKFVGCMYGCASKRFLDNTVLTDNVGFNTASVVTSTNVTTTGENVVIANNVAHGAWRAIRIFGGAGNNVHGNISYNHGMVDPNNNNTPIGSVFNSDNCCISLEGARNNTVYGNHLYGKNPGFTQDVHTVFLREMSHGNTTSNIANSTFTNVGHSQRVGDAVYLRNIDNASGTTTDAGDLLNDNIYYISETGLTDDTFALSTARGGLASGDLTLAGSSQSNLGLHQSSYKNFIHGNTCDTGNGTVKETAVHKASESICWGNEARDFTDDRHVDLKNPHSLNKDGAYFEFNGTNTVNSGGTKELLSNDAAPENLGTVVVPQASIYRTDQIRIQAAGTMSEGASPDQKRIQVQFGNTNVNPSANFQAGEIGNWVLDVIIEINTPGSQRIYGTMVCGSTIVTYFANSATDMTAGDTPINLGVRVFNGGDTIVTNTINIAYR